jgi:OOP family OmpA-OmpF porin
LLDVTVIIVGHTDSGGSESYNQNLSETRAQAVADYLNTRHGISKTSLLVGGLGESRPIAPNDSEEGRSKNRRVEFIRAD